MSDLVTGCVIDEYLVTDMLYYWLVTWWLIGWIYGLMFYEW